MGLTFIVLFMLFGELKKSSFTPLNCWVTKLTLRCLLSLKRPLTSIRSGKVGEIQWSMTKVVFVLDFGFENISPNRTTTILVLPCRLLLFTVVGSGDRQAKWRNCHRCISSPAEHSRQRYQKINFPNPRMHFPQKLVKWYCFSILILCFDEFFAEKNGEIVWTYFFVKREGLCYETLWIDEFFMSNFWKQVFLGNQKKPLHIISLSVIKVTKMKFWTESQIYRHFSTSGSHFGQFWGNLPSEVWHGALFITMHILFDAD